MRKLVKKEKRCKQCGACKKPAQYSWFCDNCKKLICDETKSPHECGALDMSVFYKHTSSGTSDADHFELCSWKCVKAFLLNHKFKRAVWFVDLPYVEAKNSEKFEDKLKAFLREFAPDNPSMR
jgi:hypothetical protein